MAGACTATVAGSPITFSELEYECIEAGDLLTAAMLQRRVTERQPPDQPPCCPTCDRQGDPSPDEPRVLQTDRGVSSSGRRCARKGEHWKESRTGLLGSMRSEQYEDDPQPTLPPELRCKAIAETVSDIGKTRANSIQRR